MGDSGHSLDLQVQLLQGEGVLLQKVENPHGIARKSLQPQVSHCGGVSSYEESSFLRRVGRFDEVQLGQRVQVAVHHSQQIEGQLSQEGQLM
eukprot:scaffold29_cov178-Ochromonas_danica.AAC.3